ncbi:prepilin peptidase [bacterium]|nr:prepilin peptidase [bacterium]
MLIPAFVFLVGICVGSFLNVVAFRTHEKRSFVSGRSACRACGTAIAPYDLIPVISYVMLGGRCRACTATISPQYPLVEFATGALFAAFYVHDGLTAMLARDLTFVAFLVVLFVYDARYMQILDRFTVPAALIALAANVALGMGVGNALLGALVCGGFFAAQYAVSRGRWVGGGDIRLGAVMGLMLGWPLSLVALIVAYLVGALYAFCLLAAGKAKMQTQIPFGTFLSFATVVTMLFGTQIVAWYLGRM